VLPRDNRYASHSSRAFGPHPFFSRIRDTPEGRSCTPFRRTISAYLKSIRDTLRTIHRVFAMYSPCICARAHTCTRVRVRVARQDTYAEIGRNSAGVSRHQYIIEIYKFSSTPADASARARAMHTDTREIGMQRQRCSFKAAREGQSDDYFCRFDW